MNRRKFLFNTSLAGGALFFSPIVGCRRPDINEKQDDEADVMRQKVTMAMLSMQRASWEHGVAAQAFLEAGDDRMTYLMAKEAQLRQTAEGRLSVLYWDNGVTDPAASGQALLHAYKVSGEEGLKASADKMLDFLMNTTHKASDGTLHHTLNAPEIWSDSFYMAPPFLAAAGEYSEAVRQIHGMRAVLWNGEKQLLSHRWDTEKKEFVDQRFWGGGNGWAAAGVARVIELLPAGFQNEKRQLAAFVEELLDACTVWMREDGLFHNFLDQPDTFVETNLSQMLAYAIFMGCFGGWLDESHLEQAFRMRQAAWAKVDEYGYVQDACGAPFFESPGRATEAQAFFLLMETAYHKWKNSK